MSDGQRDAFIHLVRGQDIPRINTTLIKCKVITTADIMVRVHEKDEAWIIMALIPKTESLKLNKK